jgi:hypothetical protein
MHVWVKVVDLPMELRNREAIAYLVHEYATLLECIINQVFLGVRFCMRS